MVGKMTEKKSNKKKLILEKCYKFYVCLSCKNMIQCIPDNFENIKKIKEFLINHSTHTIVLLDKDQLKKLSDKRFREFNYKIKKGELCVQYC